MRPLKLKTSAQSQKTYLFCYKQQIMLNTTENKKIQPKKDVKTKNHYSGTEPKKNSKTFGPNRALHTKQKVLPTVEKNKKTISAKVQKTRQQELKNNTSSRKIQSKHEVRNYNKPKSYKQKQALFTKKLTQK